MGLPLNPDIARAAYDYLRTTPPYRRWRLPYSNEVHFVILTRVKDREGDCFPGKIRISRRLITNTDLLMQVIGHEMIHLHEYRLGIRSAHGAGFKARARRACFYHGWDFDAFIT